MSRRHFTTILLLTFHLFCYAKSRVERRILPNDLSLKEFKKINEIELKEPRLKTCLSQSSFEDSGDLTANMIFKDINSVIFLYVNNNDTKVINNNSSKRLISLSDNGSFMLYKNEENKSNFDIVGRGNQIISTFSDSRLNDSKSQVLKILDNGDILFKESLNYANLLKLDGTQLKFGPFYEEETLSDYIPGNNVEYLRMSEDGKLVVLTTEFSHVNPENYKSFPLGARIYFYDAMGELINYHDLPNPNEISNPFIISRSGTYVVAKVGSHAYIFKNGEIIFNEDVKTLGGINFSSDESLALLGTQSGTYIIDLETVKVIKKDVFKGYNKCLANKNYPYLASISGNTLYVYNYEDMEIIFTDLIGTPVSNGNDILQISGNGEMISVVHENLFRKYYAGK